MILKRFYHEGLAQASYLVGCPGTGEAIVIDANRDLDQYIAAAEKEGLEITAVTETHIHADYVSGSRELAKRTGAQLFLSDEGTADWKYGFADQGNVTLVTEGSEIKAGAVRLVVWHTPGHTPEHISFVMYDDAVNADEPLGIFTGDHVFVGDVGRPDLLERAAKMEGTMEAGAKTLFHSLRRMSDLPEHTLIWPAHGAGSACGKSLGGVPVSSVGYEKRVNWGLKVPAESQFVEEVLAGQPEPPFYFKEMKRINRDGPDFLNGEPNPPHLGAHEMTAALGSTVVVDLRDGETAMAEPIAGALIIPFTKSFTTWAGWLIPYDQNITLIAEDEDHARRAAMELAMIGLDRVTGWFGIEAARRHLETEGVFDPIAQFSMSDALRKQESGEAIILDVRGSTEREESAIPGSLHIPGGYLRERESEIPRDKQIIVSCAAGGRSPIAASVLRSLGFENVANAPGGMAEYSRLQTANV